MSQSDPTDNALAAIASILDHSETDREPERAVEDALFAVEQPIAPAQIEAEGYSKIGPGPMASIRFRWTVRRDDAGDFYVDETIGYDGAPIVSGPMSADAAIRFVDERESEARYRFELLRSEMTGRSAAANFVRKDNSGEM